MAGPSKKPAAWAFFPELFPYLLVAAIILLRNATPVLRAEFWAEDGLYFFSDALTYGFKSLWKPLFGYHFFISRVIAYVATFLPVVAAPTVYALASWGLAAFTAGYFSRAGFSWLVPSRNLRVLACVLLAVGPGTAEVFFNLTNLSSVLTFLACLLLLEEPFGLSRGKFAALTLLFLSAGQTFLLAPLVMTLAYQKRDSRYWALLGVLVLPMGLNIFGSHTEAGATRLLNYGSVPHIPGILVAQGLIRWAAAPFLGPELSGKFMAASGAIFWPSITVLAIVLTAGVYRLWVLPLRKRALVLVSYLVMVMTFGVIAITRSYAMNQIVRGSGDLMWNHRYSFLPGMIVLIFWVSFFSGFISKRRGWVKHLAVASMGLIALNCFSQWKRHEFRPDLEWPRKAAEIQTVLDLKRGGRLSAPVVIDGIRTHPYWWEFQPFKLRIDPT